MKYWVQRPRFAAKLDEYTQTDTKVHKFQRYAVEKYSKRKNFEEKDIWLKRYAFADDDDTSFSQDKFLTICEETRRHFELRYHSSKQGNVYG